MFQGTSLLSLDAKGRMTMPSRHREALALSCALEVTVTRHPDGCLLIYPRNRWEKKREAIAALPYSARFLQRIVLGSAVDLTVDKAGRVLIPADLRTLAGLEKEVALVGMGEHFELTTAFSLTPPLAAAGTAAPFSRASPRMRASLPLTATRKRSGRPLRSTIPVFRSCTRLFPK